VLLWRYSGQADMVIGTPIANRQELEVEGLIGFFVNTLPLRARLKDDMSFRDLVRKTRETVLDAHKHQDLPLEKLVETLPLERSITENPLFQVMFGVEQHSQQTVELPDLKFTIMEAGNKLAKFNLTLLLAENSYGIAGAIEYSTDLFRPATVQRMARHFERLIASGVRDPEQPLSALSLLSEAERYELLEKWNDTQRPYPSESLQQLFEAQVALAPDAIAADFDEQITFAELNRQANQLAHRLQRSGVGPDVLVGIMVERNLLMLVSVLAVIKAGGGYVPLDSTYPRERLAFMIDDTRAKVLLTQAALLHDLPDHEAEVICIDSDWSTIACESDSNLLSRISGDSLAYVIYTSGSTGRPKGVAVTHNAIKRLICNTNYVQLGASSRIAQASNFSFDAATFEIWGALLSGGKLIGISKNVALSPREMTARLKERGVTDMFLTTALFNEIASEIPSGFATLENLLFGDEVAHRFTETGPQPVLMRAAGARGDAVDV
jgi:non-ribosomal peptide synthetase component F